MCALRVILFKIVQLWVILTFKEQFISRTFVLNFNQKIANKIDNK